MEVVRRAYVTKGFCLRCLYFILSVKDGALEGIGVRN